MEIRRFGVGHRRHDGPVGTRGADASSVHADERGAVSELALKANAAIAPHSNPNLTYFLVIEGGGFVQVGDDRARVSAGDAVVWPADVVHAAWTELTPMRAIIVEFAPVSAVGAYLVAEPAEPPRAADGNLAPKPVQAPPNHLSPEEEPW
ncbi:MAG TPA: cupin domain-containing protein [Candidatus Limnocylindrales bacterium]